MDKNFEENFPNEGKFINGQKREMNQDNHFAKMEVDLLRKKYIQFTVYFEALIEVMELNRQCSIEEFGIRLRDLVIAANQGSEVNENEMV